MEIDYTTFKDTSFALLVWYKRPGMADEAKVFAGNATWNPAARTLDVRSPDGAATLITLEGDNLDRIRSVEDDIKDVLLNCDFAIALSMEDLPGENTTQYVKSGLRWER